MNQDGVPELEAEVKLLLYHDAPTIMMVSTKIKV